MVGDVSVRRVSQVFVGSRRFPHAYPTVTGEDIADKAGEPVEGRVEVDGFGRDVDLRGQAHR